MRRYLTLAKRQGVEFDRAWQWANERTVYPHDRTRRHEYKAAVAWSRPLFEAAYNDEEVPGGEAALLVAQTLPDEGNAATSGTSAFQFHVPPEERRERRAA
jgi:hypothetical protein